MKLPEGTLATIFSVGTAIVVMFLCITGMLKGCFDEIAMPTYRIRLITPYGRVYQDYTIQSAKKPTVELMWGGQVRVTGETRGGFPIRPGITAPTGWMIEIDGPVGVE